jgi:crossover junction endodeoxyribonuclease RuvC
MSRPEIKIFGVDTSLRSSGVGVIFSNGMQSRAVRYGVIENPAKRPVSQALLHLQEQIRAILLEEKPAAAAVEGIFFSRNVNVTLALGQARGVVIAACAEAGVPVYEYAPRLVKSGLTGFGAAQKNQVGFMVKSMLGLPEAPPEDAADALAIALCHANQMRLASALGRDARI